MPGPDAHGQYRQHITATAGANQPRQMPQPLPTACVQPLLQIAGAKPQHHTQQQIRHKQLQ